MRILGGWLSPPFAAPFSCSDSFISLPGPCATESYTPFPYDIAAFCCALISSGSSFTPISKLPPSSMHARTHLDISTHPVSFRCVDKTGMNLIHVQLELLGEGEVEPSTKGWNSKAETFPLSHPLTPRFARMHALCTPPPIQQAGVNPRQRGTGRPSQERWCSARGGACLCRA